MSDLVLIDGHNLCIRAYHVQQDLRTSDGLAVGGLYGYLQSMKRILRMYRESVVVVVWDGGAAQWRRDLYPPYKVKDRPEENAEEVDEGHLSVSAIVDLCRRLNKYLGIVDVRLPGVEADDIIAFIALEAAKARTQSTILSTDADFLQLVSPCVSVHRPMRPRADSQEKGDLIVAEANFTLATGYPNPVAHLVGKVLQGDDSDRIEGVPRIGKKTALKLVSESHKANPFAYDSPDTALRSLYVYLSELKPLQAHTAILTSGAIIDRNLQLSDLRAAVSRLTPLQKQKIGLRIFNFCPSLKLEKVVEFLNDFEMQGDLQFTENIVYLAANRPAHITRDMLPINTDDFT